MRLRLCLTPVLLIECNMTTPESMPSGAPAAAADVAPAAPAAPAVPAVPAVPAEPAEPAALERERARREYEAAFERERRGIDTAMEGDMAWRT